MNENILNLNRLIQVVLIIVGVIMGAIFIYNGIEILFYPEQYEPSASIKDFFDISNLKILSYSMMVLMLLLLPYANFYYNGKRRQEAKKINRVFIKVPEEIKTAIHQYLLFFKDYVRTAKNKEIDFNVIQTDEGLIIETSNMKKEEREMLQKWFDEYIDFVRLKKRKITIKKEGTTTSKKMNFLRLKLETQISNLENHLKIAKMENKLLKEHNEFLKTITLNFSQNKNVIHNQFIKDGNQQFADKIENKKS